jgi:cation transport ATPase
MALAAALESKSSHPLANAIVSGKNFLYSSPSCHRTAYCGCIAEFEGKLSEVKKISVSSLPHHPAPHPVLHLSTLGHGWDRYARMGSS